MSPLVSSADDDFHDRLRARLRRVLGKTRGGHALAGALAREVSLLACAAFCVRRQRGFTVHERAGYGGVLLALLPVFAIEMTVAHLLLAPGNPRLATVLLVLEVYSAIWLFGDYRAMRQRPCVVGEREIRIRLGLRKELRVPRGEVLSLERLPGGEEPLAASGYARCTPFGAPEHLLRFRRPVPIEEMYRPPREVSVVGLTIDDEPEFRARLSL